MGVGTRRSEQLSNRGNPRRFSVGALYGTGGAAWNWGCCLELEVQYGTGGATWNWGLLFTFCHKGGVICILTHSSVLAWRIPRMVEPSGLPSMGSHRVGHDLSDSAAAAAADLGTL